MYDLPCVRAATDDWWRGLAAHMRAAGLRDAPEQLGREPAPAWTEPRLLFSQTCGYPLTHGLADVLTPLATPSYAAPACRGARYASVFVVQAEAPAAKLADLRGGVCAVNSTDSQSGYSVLRYTLAPLAGERAFFERVIETGSHVGSLACVGSGEADLCAVDGVTHALLERHAPTALAGTRVLGFSAGAPGLPYVAGKGVSGEALERLRAAIDSALVDPALENARAALLITGAERLELEDYGEIIAMERDARALGYPRIA